MAYYSFNKIMSKICLGVFWAKNSFLIFLPNMSQTFSLDFLSIFRCNLKVGSLFVSDNSEQEIIFDFLSNFLSTFLKVCSLFVSENSWPKKNFDFFSKIRCQSQFLSWKIWRIDCPVGWSIFSKLRFNCDNWSQCKFSWINCRGINCHGTYEIYLTTLVAQSSCNFSTLRVSVLSIFTP